MSGMRRLRGGVGRVWLRLRLRIGLGVWLGCAMESDDKKNLTPEEEANLREWRASGMPSAEKPRGMKLSEFMRLRRVVLDHLPKTSG